MENYIWLKYIHVISATVIFGTGLGTAFQMWMAHRTGNTQAIAVVARQVVRADWLFTTPAVVIQPVTGALLAHIVGYGPGDVWLEASVLLYGFAGVCWLPVVWLQIRMRNLATAAAACGKPLPAAYHTAARWWFILGWPAFGAVLVIFHLMISRPPL